MDEGKRKRGSKRYTPVKDVKLLTDDDLAPTEDEKNEEFVRRLVLRSLHDTQIIEICRDKLQIGKYRTQTLIDRARIDMRTRVEKNRPFAKSTQIARCHELLRKLNEPRFKKMKGGAQVQLPMPPNIASRLIQLEHLIADLEGNRAPTEIVVNHQLRQSMAVYISNMSDEDFAAIQAESHAVAELADRAMELESAQPKALIGQG